MKCFRPADGLLFVAAIMLAAVTNSAYAQQIQINKDNRTIAITTSDAAKADAEIAQVHIGFTLYAADEKTAYANASDISDAVINALTKAGVPKSAIQSESQNISEQQIYQLQGMPEADREKHRFFASQNWTVLTGAKDAADVLNVAINSGANNSGQIEWEVRDNQSLQAEAAAHALERARKIAEQMAKGLNANLGGLVYASNEAPPPPSFALQSQAGGHGEGFGAGMAAQTVSTKALRISPQQVTKSATVYAVFAIQ